MVDMHSHRKLFLHGNSQVIPRETLPNFRMYNSEFSHRVFSNPHPSSHKCSLNRRQDIDMEHWPAFLLTFGIKQTVDSSHSLHFKEKVQDPLLKEPEKLLYAVGQRGSKESFFHYPRGLAVNYQGDLAVADTENHRVQIFNASGVLKFNVGSQGSTHSHFESPQSITAMPNGNFALADTGNCRIPVLRPNGLVRFSYLTKSKPVAITCDLAYNLFTATENRQIEVYEGKTGRFQTNFPLRGPHRSPQVSLAADSEKQELIVCETSLKLIRFYNYSGSPLREFEPQACLPGLSMLPISVCVDAVDKNLVIIDAINHTANVYDRTTGEILRMVLSPTDDLGSAQTVVLTPEGHLVVTEFSITGHHCLKIFRYRDCNCHRRAKRSYSTPIPYEI